MKREIKYWDDLFDAPIFGRRTPEECEKRYEIMKNILPQELAAQWHPIFGDCFTIRRWVASANETDTKLFLNVYESFSKEKSSCIEKIRAVTCLRMSVAGCKPSVMKTVEFMLTAYVYHYCDALLMAQEEGTDVRECSRVAFENTMDLYE